MHNSEFMFYCALKCFSIVYVCMRMRTRTCDVVNFRGDHYYIGQATPLTTPPSNVAAWSSR